MPPPTPSGTGSTTTTAARRATSPAASTTAASSTRRAATPTTGAKKPPTAATTIANAASRPAPKPAATSTSTTTAPKTPVRATTTTTTTATKRPPSSSATTTVAKTPSSTRNASSSPTRTPTTATATKRPPGKPSPSRKSSPTQGSKAPPPPLISSGKKVSPTPRPKQQQSQPQQQPADQESQPLRSTSPPPPNPPATPKKPEPGKLPIDTETMSSDIHELNVEIAERDEQIKDREKVNSERERNLDYNQAGLEEFDFVLPPLDDCQRQAQEAELLLIGAQEELRMAEKAKQITVPQFELVGKNKDAAIAKTAQLKKDIDEAEVLLEASDAEIKKLEKSLAHASSVYKAERERRALLVDKLETELDELRKVVELSVVSMLPIDDDPNVLPGLESLRQLSLITAQRDMDISTSARLEREIAASVIMKREHAEAIKTQKAEDEEKMKQMREAQLSAVRSSIWAARDDLERQSDQIVQQIQDGQAALRNPRVASDAPGGLGVPQRKGAEKREGATLHSDLVKQEEVDFQEERLKLMKELGNLSARVTNTNARKEELLKQRGEAVDKTDLRRQDKQNELQKIREHTDSVAAENSVLRSAIQTMTAHAEARRRLQQMNDEQQRKEQEAIDKRLVELQEKKRRREEQGGSEAAIKRVRAKLMENEVSSILANFDKFDANRDGLLDRFELSSAIKQVLVGNLSTPEAVNKLVADIIDAADDNGDGKISIVEMKLAFASSDSNQNTIPPSSTQKQKQDSMTPVERVRSKLMDDEISRILENFSKFDKNGDGLLDSDELTAAVKSVLQGNLSSEEAVANLVQNFITSADNDKDGKLSIKELKVTFSLDERIQTEPKNDKVAKTAAPALAKEKEGVNVEEVKPLAVKEEKDDRVQSSAPPVKRYDEHIEEL